MPTYGYRCPKCSTEFEVWQTMRDEPGAPCPNCGAAANRLFFPAGIVFKGSGFYKTDSRGAESSSITSVSSDSGSSSKPAKSSSNGESGSKSDAAKADTSSPSTSADSATTTKKSASTDTAG